MSKEEFVSRMLSDIEKRKKDKEEKERKAKSDLNDYIAMRKYQATKYAWRKRKR